MTLEQKMPEERARFSPVIKLALLEFHSTFDSLARAARNFLTPTEATYLKVSDASRRADIVRNAQRHGDVHSVALRFDELVGKLA